MSQVDHSSRAHALLSASGAKRWMSCTPSARFEEQFEDETSVFAEEGTLAHEMSEIRIAHEIGDISKRQQTSRINQKRKHELFAEEMLDYVEHYVNEVMERVGEARKRSSDAEVMIEERLDFSRWVPEGFGTGDILIVSDGVLEVVDLKYGKGVPVSAVDNPQMRLYGLGALAAYDALYDIETVRMTIVQPRLDSVSTDEMSAEELLAFGEEVKVKADLAWAGEGEFNPGDHCRFCKAKAVCRARAEKNLDIARYEFKDPDQLSNEEIGQILLEAEEIKRWAADVQEYALKQASNGEQFDGWKLVEGRSIRKIRDPQQAIEILLDAGYHEDQLIETKPLSLTKLEKNIGKKRFNELVEDLIEKPPGKPTLARDHDKRPAIDRLADAKADFE